MNLERSSVERSTMRKVYWRLLPLTILTYFLCYLDRINVSFAALTMNKELGLDAATYGMAAGAFFWGYFILEVPSNLILEKVGARRWIGRIMISWGIVGAATAFVVSRSMASRTRGPRSTASPMCETSNSPTDSRTALCSLIVPAG